MALSTKRVWEASKSMALSTNRPAWLDRGLREAWPCRQNASGRPRKAWRCRQNVQNVASVVCCTVTIGVVGKRYSQNFAGVVCCTITIGVAKKTLLSKFCERGVLYSYHWGCGKKLLSNFCERGVLYNYQSKHQKLHIVSRSFHRSLSTGSVHCPLATVYWILITTYTYG